MTDKAPNSWPLATPLASTDSFLINFGEDGATPGAGNPRRLRASVLTAFLATATLAAGTITTSQPMTLTQTWNAGGVTFRGKENVFMVTAAAAGSTAERWMGGAAGTTELFSIASSGIAYAGNPSAGFSNTGLVASGLTFGSGTGSALVTSGEQLNGYVNNVNRLGIVLDAAATFIRLNNGGMYQWSSTALGNGTPDLILARDAANIHAWRNSTNAQAGRIYNTFTDASNGEWASFDWATTANLFRIRAQANGTGTVRGIAIDAISKAGAAANTDIPAGTWAVLRDTSGSTTKLIYNNGGTIMAVSLT